MEMMNLAQAGLSFLWLAVYVAGMIAAIVFRRASGATALLIAGFAVGAAAWALRLLNPLFVKASHESYGLITTVENLVGLVGAGLIVGGLFGVLGDVCRRLDRAEGPGPYGGRPGGRTPPAYGEARERPPYDRGGEPPAPRAPGSPDIQR